MDPYFFYITFRLLLGLSATWEREYIQLFGESWTYADGLASKTHEGFFESGPQLILLTHIHHQASWPTMQPLTQGSYTKAYYFPSNKPGKLYLESIRIHFDLFPPRPLILLQTLLNKPDLSPLVQTLFMNGPLGLRTGMKVSFYKGTYGGWYNCNKTIAIWLMP